MPAPTISAPTRPAWTGVKPRGRTMSSTHVTTPLKTPRPMKKTTSVNWKSRWRSASLMPSKTSARSPAPSAEAGVGGRSLAKTRKISAPITATTP